MMVRAPAIAVLVAAFGACGISEPTIVIEASGNQFRFHGYRDGRAPTLNRINVNSVDASSRSIDPVVCLLDARTDRDGEPVASWTYGSELPTLAIQQCRPLAPRSWYRIGVSGMGHGNSLFFTDAQGNVTVGSR